MVEYVFFILRTDRYTSHDIGVIYHHLIIKNQN